MGIKGMCARLSLGDFQVNLKRSAKAVFDLTSESKEALAYGDAGLRLDRVPFVVSSQTWLEPALADSGSVPSRSPERDGALFSIVPR